MGGRKGEGFELSNHTLKQKMSIILTSIDFPLHRVIETVYTVSTYTFHRTNR
jgi:hypothetical protein